MNCKYGIEDIINYTEGALPQETADKIREHLESCENCMKAYNLFSFTGDFISSGAVLDNSAYTRIMDSIDEGRYKSKKISFALASFISRFKPLLKPVVISAVVCLIAVSAFKFSNQILNLFNKDNDCTVTVNEETELFPIAHDNKYGFIDKNGNTVIEPQFDGVSGFKEGLAKVLINDKYGFIDKTGKVVIDAKYHIVSDFSEGLACVNEFFSRGFVIDKNGNKVLNLETKIPKSFSEGLVMFRLAGVGISIYPCGYLDKNGKTVIPPIYDSAHAFSEGLALVRRGDEYCFIDKNGRLVIDTQYKQVYDFHEGLARFQNSDGKFGYMNTKGKVVIEPVFGDAHDFSDGLACVLINGKYGYINNKGKTVISPKYDIAYNFSDGIACVMEDNNSLAVTQFRSIVRDLKYPHNIEDFLSDSPDRGVIIGTPPPISGKWGYINKDGSYAITPKFERAGDFSGGRAIVRTNTEWGYIDKSGKFIWISEIQTDKTFSLADGTVIYCNTLDNLRNNPHFPSDEYLFDSLYEVFDVDEVEATKKAIEFAGIKNDYKEVSRISAIRVKLTNKKHPYVPGTNIVLKDLPIWVIAFHEIPVTTHGKAPVHELSYTGVNDSPRTVIADKYVFVDANTGEVVQSISYSPPEK